jgi:hypothetical protein
MTEYAYRYHDSIVLRLLSDVLSPPVFGAFIFAAICFKVIPTAENAFTLFCVCFLFQSLLPVIYLFTTLRMQTISDIHLHRKEERNLVFPTLVAMNITGFLVLHVLKAPEILTAMMLASTILLVLVWIINLYYKISVHAIGISGLLTGIFFAFGPAAFILELFLPLVAWVRFRAGAHNVRQLLSGAALGHFVTYVVLKAFLS